jgi:HNH endonuclease
MALCLFCDSSLNESTKPEHILLNALGGRKTTRYAICSAHNNDFGGTIDDALASQVLATRNLFQLKSGSGDEAPAVNKVQAGTIKINIKGDGRLELADKPFTIEKLSEDSWSVHLRVNSEEEINRYIPHIAAKLRIPEDRLRTQLAGAQISLVSERPGFIGHQLSFGGPEAIRSIVKAGLVLWSTLVGNDEVRGAPYDAARSFICNAGEQFVRSRTNLDSRYYADVDRMKAEFGPLFNLIYVRSNEDGRVVGHFTLYNLLGWHFVLAEGGGTPNRKIALISNPESPSRWSDEAATLFDIPFEWLMRPDYSNEMVRSKARIEAMLKHYVESSQPRALSEIADECMASLSLAPDQALTPEQQIKFTKLLSYRLGHYAMSLPYVETLSSERSAEIVRKNKD